MWFNKIAEEQKTDQPTNGQEELEESTPIEDDPEPTIVITFLYIFNSYTLVRLIMTGYIVAGKNMAELPKNRQKSVYLSNVLNYLSSFNYDGLFCGG